ncbi:MAG: glycoside hydrolase family 43 protein [Candidatus Marinimicrobia bacterium]|nr:glycoside hydrolase family 43 protein [Candidatus Neomarinimicrobiota bacterium]MCF7828716.1 glycoside hydrolase family 43 protein [Candidatus Neomarinimicrobiota bacterium]
MQILRRILQQITLMGLAAAVVLMTGCGGEQAQSQVAPVTFTNPLNDSGPDPWMTFYEGHYYLAATTWGGPEVGLTMRKAKTINELKIAEPVRIFQDSTESRCCNYWAPEFFLLDGPNGPRWYGYFTGGAPGDDFVNTQYMHVIESEGTDPMGPYTYKGKLVERNALDGGVMQLNGKLYAIYSVWNETQDLAIKEMSNPWTTIGEETVISKPMYEWERQTHPVNEGPVALQRNGKTFIVYAASACWGPDYKLGLLTYNGGDPLEADSWDKKPEPVFERADSIDVYAPGHNTFFKSPDGTEDWMAYHANDLESDGCDMGRTPRIQKFTWNEDGTPNFGTPVSTTEELAVPSR